MSEFPGRKMILGEGTAGKVIRLTGSDGVPIIVKIYPAQFDDSDYFRLNTIAMQMLSRESENWSGDAFRIPTILKVDKGKRALYFEDVRGQNLNELMLNDDIPVSFKKLLKKLYGIRLKFLKNYLMKKFDGGTLFELKKEDREYFYPNGEDDGLPIFIYAFFDTEAGFNIKLIIKSDNVIVSPDPGELPMTIVDPD